MAVEKPDIFQILENQLRFDAACTAARRHFNRTLRKTGEAGLSCMRPFLERNYPNVNTDAVIAEVGDALARRYGK